MLARGEIGDGCFLQPPGKVPTIMSGYQPGYGALPQQFNQDPVAAMQSQTAANNALSANYESKKRLAKNYENYNHDSNINWIRNQLSNLIIVPLRKSLEITTYFPLELLPVQAQNFVKSAAQALGVSEEMVAVSLLGASFIAARGNFKIKIDEHWFEILTGFIIAAAPSGERKSVVVDLMRGVFTEFQAEIQMHFSVTERQSDHQVLHQTVNEMKRDLAKCMNKKIQSGCPLEVAQSELRTKFAGLAQLQDALQKSKWAPRILLDTPTLEALAVELQRQNEAVGIFEAEGGFWKRRLQAALDDILLKGYTGESFASDTKTLGSEFLLSPVIAICSFVQPNVLQTLYADVELAGHGVTARILPVLLPSRTLYRSDLVNEIPTDALDWYKELVRRLLEIKRPAPGTCERTFHILSPSSAAKARIRHYGSNIDEQIRNGYFEKFPAFGAKLVGHAVRLAGAIHLMSHTEPQSEEINEQSMQAGIALAEFFRVHAEAAFTPEARDGIVYSQKICDWMKRHRRHIFDEREAHRGIGSGRYSMTQTCAGIDELERCHFLRKYITSGKVLCVVNPNAHEVTF